MLSPSKQTLIALDLEGVLVPEIWIAVAERTGLEFLTRTTRDEPDYDILMKGRLNCLAEHGIGLSLVADVIGALDPLPGANEFLEQLRSQNQVVILSDTFEEFARPLMAKLGWPALLCHRLEVSHDAIIGYRLRLPDQKRAAVAAFQQLNYRVVAAGDSYNDITMLRQADAAFLFRSPANVISEFVEFPHCTRYDDLLANLVGR